MLLPAQLLEVNVPKQMGRKFGKGRAFHVNLRWVVITRSGKSKRPRRWLPLSLRIRVGLLPAWFCLLSRKTGWQTNNFGVHRVRNV